MAETFNHSTPSLHFATHLSHEVFLYYYLVLTFSVFHQSSTHTNDNKNKEQIGVTRPERTHRTRTSKFPTKQTKTEIRLKARK